MKGLSIEFDGCCWQLLTNSELRAFFEKLQTDRV